MKRFLIIFILILLLSSTSGYTAEARQTGNRFEKQVTLTLSANYLLYLPKDYQETDKTFPLVLFLHGAGERGDDLEHVKTHGLPKLIQQGRDFPFIVVSPQCPADKFWNMDMLSALLDDIEARYRVDRKREYVTGLSMGGQGTWTLALAQPHRFAAIVPICGWTVPAFAFLLKDMPIWVFHGAKDEIVPISISEATVKALKSCGSSVRFTVYPEAGHDSWTETYNNPELYKWLLEQSLDGKKSD